MTANGWSNMVEEELLPPTAGMTANGWSGTPPFWPLANDDFALLPHLVHLCSRALVHHQEENLRQADDEDVAGFIYAAANGWPAAIRTIVEPDPDGPDVAICRALCRSEGDDDVMGLNCSWWCLRRG